MKKKKLLQKILVSQRNVSFKDFVSLVEAFGFNLQRITGSHHLYKHPAVTDLLNIQSDGGDAKPYQIKQFLNLIEKYNLTFKED